MESAKSILSEMDFDSSKLHLESFGAARVPALGGAGSVGDKAKFTVEFARSGKVALADASMSLLELAEANGVDINYGCRSGSCGDCKVKVLKGNVKMSCEDGLDAADKANGYVLSCVSSIKSDCVLDL